MAGLTSAGKHANGMDKPSGRVKDGFALVSADGRSSSAAVIGGEEVDTVIEVDIEVEEDVDNEEKRDGGGSEDGVENEKATVPLTKMFNQWRNYEYDVNGHHPEIGADPTFNNNDDDKITSMTVMEVDRGIKDEVVSMATRTVEGGTVEDQDNEIAVLSTAGVVMNGIVMVGEKAGSEWKTHQARGKMEETAKLKEDVR
jgi:hypothetical protein